MKHRAEPLPWLFNSPLHTDILLYGAAGPGWRGFGDFLLPGMSRNHDPGGFGGSWPPFVMVSRVVRSLKRENIIHMTLLLYIINTPTPTLPARWWWIGWRNALSCMQARTRRR